jgi:hypothetical protein
MRRVTPPARPVRGYLGILLAGVFWLAPCAAPGLLAQGPGWQSHGPIPGDSQLKPTDLAGRLKMARESAQAQDLLRQSRVNPQLLQEILKDLKDSDKEKLNDLVKAVGKDRIKLDPHDPFVKQLEKFFKDQANSSQQSRGLDPGLEEALKRLLPKEPSAPPAGAGPADANPGGEPGQPPPNPAESQPPANSAPRPMNGPSGLPHELEDPLRNSRLGEWVLNQLKDSPELRDTVAGLLRARPRTGPGGPDGLANAWGDKLLQGVKPYLPRPSFWTDKVLPRLPRVSLPALPKVRVPEVHVNPPALPSVHLPHISLPPAPSGRGGYAWLVLPVCFILALIGWRIHQGRQRRWGGFGRFGSGDGWVLGPWPVAPAAVSSEAELIQAFEYLTLLKLGPEARSWNHLAIAAGLGGGEPDRRRAADQLAMLYEQYRYAPAHEPLEAEVLHSARRALAFLAEGAPA